MGNVRRMHFWQKITYFNEKVHISLQNAKMTPKSEKMGNVGKVRKVTPRGPDVPFALKTNGKIDVWESFSPKVHFWVKRAKFSENDEKEPKGMKFSENDDS